MAKSQVKSVLLLAVCVILKNKTIKHFKESMAFLQ